MIPESLEPRIYALLRIVFGLMFLTYGLQKFGMLGGQAAPFLSWPFGIAGVLEVLLGALIAVGLFAKPAAFVASGEMAVAYFMVHQPQGALPVMNQGIPAVLFCFAFLYVATRGAGAMSIDGGRVSR
ncbi:MAG: DoxX family protein [Acidobacteria bacterium]|nr:DoxX family protein [Acidobacteriota bacterium]